MNIAEIMAIWDDIVNGRGEAKTPSQNTGGIMAETVTLTRRGTDKSGNTAYFREGVRASVYFNKHMFSGEPPAEISITADSLAEPGNGPAPGRPTSPEQVAKLQENAEKARLRAEKAQDRARKAAERAAKFGGKPAGSEPDPAAVAESAVPEGADA